MKSLRLFIIFSVFTSIALAQDWEIVPNAPTGLGRYDDVFFLNENIGWIASGTSSTLFKTKDGGETWVEQLTDDSYFRNVAFLNEDIGFLGTLFNDFFKTTDGGTTWELINMDPSPDAICGLDVVGDSTVYGVGSWFTPAWLVKSTDSGESFTYTDMSAYAAGLVEALFIDEMHGFVSGRGHDGAVILETFDGGDTWTEIFNSGIEGEYVWKLQLRENNTHIFASIQSSTQGKLITSFDAGATWETKNFPDPSVQAVGFITDTRGWMGGQGSGFYETNDGGDTWTDIGLGSSLNRFFFLSDELVYCSGNEIYRFEQEILSSNDFENVETPKDLNVVIAPIPVKEKLQITIEFEHSDNLVIELYDMQGKLIKRLIRDRIPSAQRKDYDFEFNYPAGNYVLDIHTNNGRRSKTIVKN